MGERVVEKIVRQRIYGSFYWKSQCFGLNAATLCDRAVELTEIGGLFANQKPTLFLCLVLKLVLIQPSREIIEEMLNQSYFKYLTAVAAFYVRLCYSSRDVFQLLEPLLADYRKIRFQRHSNIILWHIDEFIDALLNEERVCDLALPRLASRARLEEIGLPPRQALVDWEPS